MSFFWDSSCSSVLKIMSRDVPAGKSASLSQSFRLSQVLQSHWFYSVEFILFHLHGFYFIIPLFLNILWCYLNLSISLRLPQFQWCSVSPVDAFSAAIMSNKIHKLFIEISIFITFIEIEVAFKIVLHLESFHLDYQHV